MSLPSNDITIVERGKVPVPHDPGEDILAALDQLSRTAELIEIRWPSRGNENLELEAKDTVGIFPITKDATLWIKPKVPIANLFGMLEYVYGIDPFTDEGKSEIDDLKELFESLAIWFAEKIIQKNRHGLYRAFVERIETLSYSRGTIQIIPTTMELLRGNLALSCRYKEITDDLVENQILKWTLHQILSFRISKKTKRSLRNAYHQLPQRIALREFDGKDCSNRDYNKLNHDYKILHKFCRFFLEQTGPTLEEGRNDFIPFQMYMPNLFEKFVRNWLKENAHNEFTVSKNLTHKLKTSEEIEIEFKYDIPLLNPNSMKPIAVLDTKYKREDQPSPQDVRQVVAYAVNLGCKDAFLVYPSTKTPNKGWVQVGDIRVHTLVFDLNKQDLQEAGEIFKRDLVMSCRDTPCNAIL